MKAHQLGGCLLGGPLDGIRRGSLWGSLKFETLWLFGFFSVFPWPSSFLGGSSEDFSFVISSSVFLNTLKEQNGYVRACTHFWLIHDLSMFRRFYYVLWFMMAREHVWYWNHPKYVGIEHFLERERESLNMSRTLWKK